MDIYRLSEASGLAKDFGLRDQIRRAAVSVPSNIAEGDERDTDKDGVRFLYIAKGSLAELRTQLEIASDIGHINKTQFTTLENHFTWAWAPVGQAAIRPVAVKGRAERQRGVQERERRCPLFRSIVTVSSDGCECRMVVDGFEVLDLDLVGLHAGL